MLEKLQGLVKALEAGSYDSKPSTLVQGSALQQEDLSPVMHNVTFGDQHIKLQKDLQVKKAKGQLVQFMRQLSYGTFGGTARFEGGVGDEDTSDYQRAVVPMAYYSTVRRVTIASNEVEAFDGIKAEDREADSAAKQLAGDIEFDLFRGKSDFSNAGVFDGNPLAVAEVPNILGLDPQVRQSDILSATQDLMFAEYGSDQSVILAVNGNLSQSAIEDGAVRSAMNMGYADHLYIDPIILSAYNKISFAKERIMLAGTAESSTGAHLRTQWTSSAPVALEASRFLSAKTSPARAKTGALGAPAVASPVLSGSDAGTSFEKDEVYGYLITAVNIRGESPGTAKTAGAIAVNGEKISLTITNNGASYYNVYRTAAGGQISKFIGRVKAGAGASTVFTDLNNKAPGGITGFFVQADTMAIHQLTPYSRLRLAISDLSIPEAHYRFLTLAVYQPRKDVLLDNLQGDI